MDLRWRWMLAGGMSSYRTLPPTPSTRSCARSRRRGPTKIETKDTAYLRSAISTRVGSSTQHCWTNEAACFADRGYRLQISGKGHDTAVCKCAAQQEVYPVRILMSVAGYFLTNYGTGGAEELDRVRVGVEDAHPHGRRGEQEPEDPAL